MSGAAIATSLDEKIRQRAYEIWENDGRTGNPEGHWFRAQHELADQGQERPVSMRGKMLHKLPRAAYMSA